MNVPTLAEWVKQRRNRVISLRSTQGSLATLKAFEADLLESFLNDLEAWIRSTEVATSTPSCVRRKWSVSIFDAQSRTVWEKVVEAPDKVSAERIALRDTHADDYVTAITDITDHAGVL